MVHSFGGAGAQRFPREDTAWGPLAVTWKEEGPIRAGEGRAECGTEAVRHGRATGLAYGGRGCPAFMQGREGGYSASEHYTENHSICYTALVALQLFPNVAPSGGLSWTILLYLGTNLGPYGAITSGFPLIFRSPEASTPQFLYY